MAAGSNPGRTVAIAIDDSECSAQAFEYAVKNVIRPQSDEVIIIHARPEKYGCEYGCASPPTLLKLNPSWERNWVFESDSLLAPSEFFENLERAYTKKADKVAKEYFKKAEDAKLKAITVVAEGDAREIVVKEAAKVDANLLVVGCRGLSTLKRMWLGSVSEYVIHNAPCPVLIVRPCATSGEGQTTCE